MHGRWTWLHLLWAVPTACVVGYVVMLFAWIGHTSMGMCTVAPTAARAVGATVAYVVSALVVACPWAALPWARPAVRLPVASVVLVAWLLLAWAGAQTCVGLSEPVPL